MIGTANSEWDAFISHASEDKDDFVRPLAEGLKKRGMTVWFDEFELKVGDSLRGSIDRGLSRSRFGIVVLSPHFFEKRWPQNELDGLFARETGDAKVILPVWHNIDAEGVRRFSSILTGRFATSSSKGLKTVIDDLMRVIAPSAIAAAALGANFDDDLRTQLAGLALAAVAPLADNEARGRIVNARLRDATESLAVLLAGETIRKPEHRAALQVALGDGLHRLGEKERGTKRLEQAVEAYGAALTVNTRDRVPDEWARTQNNLGNALLALGKRESSTKRLEQAETAYRAALSMSSHERNPLDWGATHVNLGSALLALGEREAGRKRLDEAIDAYGEALKVSTREKAPLQWAATQNNLGNALRALGEREAGIEHLEQAAATHREAL